jgi:hypothetical protein
MLRDSNQLVTCSSCGTDNRLAPQKKRISKCSRCGSYLVVSIGPSKRSTNQHKTFGRFALSILAVMLICGVVVVQHLGLDLSDVVRNWKLRAFLSDSYKSLFTSVSHGGLYNFRLFVFIMFIISIVILMTICIKPMLRFFRVALKSVKKLFDYISIYHLSVNHKNTCGFCKCHVNDGAVQCYHCGATYIINQLKIGVLLISAFGFFVGLPEYGIGLIEGMKISLLSIAAFLFGLFLPTRIWVKQIGTL